MLYDNEPCSPHCSTGTALSTDFKPRRLSAAAFSPHPTQLQAQLDKSPVTRFCSYSFTVNIIHCGVLVSSWLGSADNAESLEASAWEAHSPRPDWFHDQDLRLEVSVLRGDGAICPLYTSSIDAEICAIANDSDSYCSKTSRESNLPLLRAAAP